MEQASELEKGDRIKIFLNKDNFVFRGEFLRFDGKFLVMKDSKKGCKSMFNVSEILQIEVTR